MKKLVSVLLSLVMMVLLVNPSSANESRPGFSDEEKAVTNMQNRTLYDTFLVAFNANPPDNADMNPRAAYCVPVRNYAITYRGGNNPTPVSQRTIAKSDLISWMQNCELFFFHTHGSSGTLQISQTPSFLYTTDLNSYSLSNLYCAVLLSCKSGKTVPTTTNMVQTFINRGATSVIGFNDDIYMDDANTFAIRLAQNSMQYQMSINDSILYMSTSGMIENIISKCVTAGSTYLSLGD